MVQEFATYIDVDGSTKRYVDMDEQTTNEVDLVGHTVIGLISGRSWPIKEKALKAAMATLSREEVGVVLTLIHDMECYYKHSKDVAASQKRRLDG